MNYFLIYFFILVIFIKQIQGFSEEFYECIDQGRKINSHLIVLLYKFQKKKDLNVVQLKL